MITVLKEKTMKEDYPNGFKKKNDYDFEEYKAILLFHKREYALIKYQYLKELFDAGIPIIRRSGEKRNRSLKRKT